VFFTAFISLQIIASPSNFEELSTTSTKGAKWDSTGYHRLYEDKRLEEIIQKLTDRLLKKSKRFEEEALKLSEAIRNRLAHDSLDSRTDQIDLLSVMLKRKIEEKWEDNFGDDLSYDHSQLWSLTKYRLKKILQPEIKLTTGAYIFRKKGLRSNELVIACASPNVSGDLKPLKRFNQGGIIFDLVKIQTGKKYTWFCDGRKFEVSSKSLKAKSNLKIEEEIDLSSAFETNHLKMALIMGLTASVPKAMHRVTRFFLWLNGDYSLQTSKKVNIKKRLNSLLQSSDVFLHGIAFPDANKFGMSIKAENGVEYIYTKEIAHPLKEGKKLRVDFHVILPPLSSAEVKESQKNEYGVYLSQREVLEALQKRKGKSLNVFNIGCFGQRNFNEWASIFHLSPLKNPPFVIASHRGQQGESKLEVLATMETALSGLDAIISAKSAKEVKASLNHKGLLARWVQGKDHAGFQAITNRDKPYDVLLTKDSNLIELRELSAENKELKIFAAIL
jgi:hypothetical protein